MKFKTGVTNVQKDGSEIIRGEKLTDLIANRTFPEAIYLILRGQLPDPSQLTMFNAILTSVIDHGSGTASALNARVSASAKNDMHTALAAGILGFGPRHGVAVGAAMRFFYENLNSDALEQILNDMKNRKEYVPGFGHKIFDVDPRAAALFEKAKQHGIYGAHCEFSHTVHAAVNQTSSKKLPINVDGAIAAILCDMQFDSIVGNGVFLIGRVPGLIAQIHEEITNDVGLRRLDENDVEYVG